MWKSWIVEEEERTLKSEPAIHSRLLHLTIPISRPRSMIRRMTTTIWVPQSSLLAVFHLRHIQEEEVVMGMYHSDRQSRHRAEIMIAQYTRPRTLQHILYPQLVHSILPSPSCLPRIYQYQRHRQDYRVQAPNHR
jgi:hypothetical protein